MSRRPSGKARSDSVRGGPGEENSRASSTGTQASSRVPKVGWVLRTEVPVEECLGWAEGIGREGGPQKKKGRGGALEICGVNLKARYGY